jgi:hypothetical protein
MMKRTFAITLLLAASVCQAAPVTLIGRDLSPRQVTLQSVRNGVATYFDSQRAYHSEPLARLLQFRFTPDAALASDDALVLELTDGQRFRGQWIGMAEDGDALRWRHAVLGEVTARLETVRAIRPATEADLTEPPTSDQVTLANGDVMRGFVMSASPDGLMMRLEDRRDAVALPRDRIVSVTLANPAQTVEGESHMIHLADASRVRTASLTVEGDELRMGGEPAVSIALASVKRIDVAAGGARLIELSDLAMTTTSGGDVFGMPMPPSVEAGIWRMHAPVTVRFDLPAGATRFGAVAELDASDSQPLRWADFVVRVTAGDASQVCHITRDEPSCRINLPLHSASRALIVEVDAGANGPVMDRLRLRDAVVLIESSP